MSNTCCNSIRIDGTRHAVKAILTVLENTPRTAWHSRYLHNMLSGLGISEKSLTGVDTREEITSFELKDGTIHIESESAWNFKTEAWELVKRRFPSVSILYRAEEFGNDIFETNDLDKVHFKDVYCLDWADESKGTRDTEYFSDEESLVKYVAENIDPSVKKFEDINDAFDALNEKDDDSFAVLHEITYDEYSCLS